MKFDINSSHGKAGEYYFSYWICNNFKWPCRLLDIDVGIDAQIELFNEQYHSTGDFIGVQIKTTMFSEPDVSISLKNLEYWRSIDDPIILVSITLENGPKIFWKLINGSDINERIKDIKDKGNKSGTVKFTQDDELLPSHKEDFSKLSLKKLASVLDEKCVGFGAENKKITALFTKNWNNSEEYIETDPVQLGLDLSGVEDYIIDFEQFFEKYIPICDLVSKYPELKTLSSSYNSMEVEYEKSKGYIESFIDKVSELDVDYDYEIRNTWKVSSTNKILFEIFEDKYW
ncbi:DUF4365 domain-containing protein [Photobacterium leiognathi]|uniref:DUF4365 domain-containing protein n=1 Tax=Photobacterium leiognathi TaxID=553611 RepID=UPI002980C01E|nr:DUF4365 domain-containing protein [Photobacterium leiognathi]